METKKTNQENLKNSQANLKQKNKNWQSGVSSSIGAAMGVTAGSIAQSAFAAEPTPVEAMHPSYTNTNFTTEQTEHSTLETSHTTVNSTANPPETTSPINNGAESEEGVAIVSYETITCEDGSQMDAAGIIINGQEAVLVDINQDGTVDVLITDLDGNGTITENEIVDIQEASIQMEDLEAATTQHIPTEDSTLMADSGDIPDYTNDADITGYMA